MAPGGDCAVRRNRNRKFAGFYPSLGFAEVSGADPAEFRHDLHRLPELPAWVNLVRDEEVFDVL
jgi:hypothetical protein